MISLEDYNAMQETTYLLRSPANARNLLESIAELFEVMRLEKIFEIFEDQAQALSSF